MGYCINSDGINCIAFLTESNIRRIAKEIIKIAHSDEAYAILCGFEASLKKLQREQQNQIVNLRNCDSNSVRKLIIADLEKIETEIEDTEQQIRIEKANHITITEEQVIDRLNKLADGDILDTKYRRSLIRIFVNKIYIYDDKITITFKIGEEDVEITKEILDKIERGLGNETLCFSEATVHQKKQTPSGVCFFWSLRESKGRPCRRQGKEVSGGHFLRPWEIPSEAGGCPKGQFTDSDHKRREADTIFQTVPVSGNMPLVVQIFLLFFSWPYLCARLRRKQLRLTFSGCQGGTYFNIYFL